MLDNIKLIIKDLQEPISLIIGCKNILGVPVEWNKLNNLGVTEWNTGKVTIENKELNVLMSNSISKEKIYIQDSNNKRYVILNK